MLLCLVLERGRGLGAGGAAHFWGGLQGDWRRACLRGLESCGPRAFGTAGGGRELVPGRSVAEAGQRCAAVLPSGTRPRETRVLLKWVSTVTLCFGPR